MSNLQAILFDCDGVLVDTERDGHRVAFNKAFAELGLEDAWSPELYAKLLEVAGGKERMRHYFKKVGWPEVEDRDAFIVDAHKRKTAIFMELTASGAMSARPGLRELIMEALDNGVTVAVCSTSNVQAVRGIVDHVVGEALSHRIRVFAGDMVPAKKPDPAIYQLALDDLSLNSARTVVVEDSNIGLRAAKAAGLRCIVTKSTYTVDEDFTAADLVVENLAAGGVDLARCQALIG